MFTSTSVLFVTLIIIFILLLASKLIEVDRLFKLKYYKRNYGALQLQTREQLEEIKRLKKDLLKSTPDTYQKEYEVSFDNLEECNPDSPNYGGKLKVKIPNEKY